MNTGFKRFISRFNEYKFKCAEEQYTQYNTILRRGYERAARSNIIICGLARDLGPSIYRSIATVETIGSLFNDHYIYIFENDSIDETKEILQNWQLTNNKIKVENTNMNTIRWGQERSLINGHLRCPTQRMKDMALYRNKCLNFVRESFSDYQYVMVIDLDYDGWSYDGIINTIGHNDWDVIGSNSIKYETNRIVYYDAWAYREIGQTYPHDDGYVNGKHFQRGDPLIKLDSVFGGMAIYKMQAFLNGVYGYVNRNNEPECEHVVFHNTMRANGSNKIYLNPSMITVIGDLEVVNTNLPL